MLPLSWTHLFTVRGIFGLDDGLGLIFSQAFEVPNMSSMATCPCSYGKMCAALVSQAHPLRTVHQSRGVLVLG